MKGIFGDLLFWGFMIVILVIFIRDWPQATALVQGFTTTYTGAVTSLANLGGTTAQPVPQTGPR